MSSYVEAGFPRYTLALLAWLSAHEPESVSATSKVLWCKDFSDCGSPAKFRPIQPTPAAQRGIIPEDWAREVIGTRNR